MNAPFFKFDFFGDEFSLIIAFIIGIAFGFALERGGFGNARILAAQFYFTNMRVFKVMFTAIVTAMLGIFFLAWIGILDLSLIYVSTTYMVPQVVGGLVLGIGFVVGGYCPGTSFVAASTGRKDGLIFIVGVVFGIFAFGEVFPFIKDFFYSTNMGQVQIHEFFGVSYGIIVLAVVIMAIGGFIGAEYVEKLMAAKNGGSNE